ncbi:MAG: hypothetical protein LBR10_14675 [Prevotellaceae bacterium]|jgi:hypothetical protein|nr:hypothetical protein [Prevotellaceae bacterium]
MSKMINRSKELLRISPKNPAQTEYSTNDGRNWNIRHPGNSAYGEFMDLTDNGDEILATTSKGLFFSKNEGRNWQKRG